LVSFLLVDLLGAKVGNFLLEEEKFYTFARSNKKELCTMKRYKVQEVMDMLRADGWSLDRQKGSHRQYVHPTKTGTVTVSNKANKTMSQFTLNSIWKQAGWR
jgi:predicted RNA binding protein YcfA (HicA-like mRNA interferase family)